MQINLYLPDEQHRNININEAIYIASEYYAVHGDSATIITLVSTDKVVNQFQLENSSRWHTFEELIELSYYKELNVIDARFIHS